MDIKELNAMRDQKFNRAERRAKGKKLGIKIVGTNKPYVKIQP